MTAYNTQRGGTGSTAEFTILETDVYLMEIVKSTIEENQYADPNKDGSKPEQLVLTWQVYELTQDQAETEGAEDYLEQKVWQRLAPYYGPVRDGGVSKFKAFIDGLRDQGLLEDFDPQAFEPESLVGIKQRVSVEKYTKGQGPNAGKPGNKVVTVMPLRRKAPTKKAAPRLKEEEEVF